MSNYRPLFFFKFYVVREDSRHPLKTSMMWPSQNFLLYNGTIIKLKVNERINNLKKYVNRPPPLWGYIQHVQIITISFQKICQSPPPLGIYTTCTNYNNLISKKSKRF